VFSLDAPQSWEIHLELARMVVVRKSFSSIDAGCEYTNDEASYGSEIKKQGRVYKELVGLVEFEQQVLEIQLACFCHPLPCHGDVLVKALNWLDEEQCGK